MKMKIDYLNKNILLGFVVLIIIILILFNTSLFGNNKVFVVVLSLVLFFLARTLLKRNNKFISGFVGEKDIEVELKKLGENYTCINSGLNTGRGNIDKIVLGPTGIWTLEVKSHKGNFTFNGEVLLRNTQKTNFLKQAYAESKFLEDLIKSKINIKIKVQPVLVFSNKFAKVRLGLKLYKGVYVIRKEWLKKLITDTHIQSFDKETIHRIKVVIENYSIV